ASVQAPAHVHGGPGVHPGEEVRPGGLERGAGALAGGVQREQPRVVPGEQAQDARSPWRRERQGQDRDRAHPQRQRARLPTHHRSARRELPARGRHRRGPRRPGRLPGIEGALMERAPLLVVDSLRKSYGDFKAVKGVSFEVFPGETYGLLGPNGAGKTTLISMIAGVRSRDAGEVTLAGTQVSSDVPASRRDIGLVPQDLAIYP